MKREFKKEYFFVAFLVLFLVVFLSTNNFLRHSFQGNRIHFYVIGGETFRLEEVYDEAYLKKGLSNRNWMCSKCGMSFRFEESKRHAFWMKDVNFPLDIIWVSRGEIVWIEKEVSHLDQERVYAPDVRADLVLEIRSGSCDKYGIEIGDSVLKK
jgi:uncharacterized membrane protein (UPF0127 family)